MNENITDCADAGCGVVAIETRRPECHRTSRRASTDKFDVVDSLIPPPIREAAWCR